MSVHTGSSQEDGEQIKNKISCECGESSEKYSGRNAIDRRRSSRKTTPQNSHNNRVFEHCKLIVNFWFDHANLWRPEHLQITAQDVVRSYDL